MDFIIVPPKEMLLSFSIGAQWYICVSSACQAADLGSNPGQSGREMTMQIDRFLDFIFVPFFKHFCEYFWAEILLPELFQPLQLQRFSIESFASKINEKSFCLFISFRYISHWLRDFYVSMQIWPKFEHYPLCDIKTIDLPLFTASKKFWPPPLSLLDVIWECSQSDKISS